MDENQQPSSSYFSHMAIFPLMSAFY